MRLVSWSGGWVSGCGYGVVLVCVVGFLCVDVCVYVCLCCIGSVVWYGV